MTPSLFSLVMMAALSVSQAAYARDWTLLDGGQKTCVPAATAPYPTPAAFEQAARTAGMFLSTAVSRNPDGAPSFAAVKVRLSTGIPTTLFYFTDPAGCAAALRLLPSAQDLN